MKIKQQIKSTRILRLGGWGAGVMLLFLFGCMIFPPVHTDETNAANRAPVPAVNTVSLSIGNNPLTLNLTPVSSDGTFAESSDMTITASTTSISGYTLSIASGSGNNATDLINTDTTNCPTNSNRTDKCHIGSLADDLTAANYKNPAADSIETVKNTWGYRPSQYGISNMSNNSGDSTDRYFPAPSANGDVIAKTDGNNTSSSETYSLKIGARVDTTIKTGTYENVFVITVVGNGVDYSIAYHDNSNEASNMPSTQSGVAYTGDNVALMPNVPMRTGYIFKGWCSANTSDDNCSGDVYQPGTNFGINQTADDNSLDLYAMWSACAAGNICYIDNGANSATGMDVQNVGTSTTTATLWASNFQRAGYGFAGWNTQADGSGTNYGPNETVTALDLSSSGLMLYAKWVAAAESGSEAVYLQDWTCSNGADFMVGSVTALTDERDDQVYAVAKLADGNCWMIENLRLDTAGTVGTNKNDETVTNASLAQGYGGAFTGLANPETANFGDFTTANSLYSITAGTGLQTIEGNDASARFPRFDNTNTSDTVSSMNGVGQNVYSYGNYYTWAAAMANTTSMSSADVSNAAATSLCPEGWQLPAGGSGVSFAAISLSFAGLDNSLGGDGMGGAAQSPKWRAYPNNFIYSGEYSGSGKSAVGTGGYYWSKSANADVSAYRLMFSDGDLTPGDANANGNKYYGAAVRCVMAAANS